MSRIRIFAGILIGMVLLFFLVRGVLDYGSDPAGRAIRVRLQSSTPSGRIDCGGESARVTAILARFYSNRDFRPAWSCEKGLLPRAEALIKVLRKADAEGLRPGDFHLARIEALLAERPDRAGGKRRPGTEQRADLDLLLTDALILYADSLVNGRVDPYGLYSEWFNFPRHGNREIKILTALQLTDTGMALKWLEPRSSGYQRLKHALAAYRVVAGRGGWPVVPDGPVLREGSLDGRVLLLRRRLTASGDLVSVTAPRPDLFDGDLARSLRRFQQRHGLPADGILNSRTIAGLNVPVEKRIRRIELNMERLRWLPEDLGERYILVNIAAFNLEVVEQDRPVMEMRIIAGKDEDEQRTFLFTGRMTYLELNPFWNVPPTIAAGELLPKIQENPRYLSSEEIRVFENWSDQAQELDPMRINWTSLTPETFHFKLRQDPGPKNPLGRIKFMFPNEFFVYLHDTPSQRLFERSRRDFSHGCIRVEKPVDLAAYLLKDDPAWTKERIVAAIALKQRQVIFLQRPIPVHIHYATAWADHDGTLHFRNDVYNGDGALEAALKGEPARPAQAKKITGDL